MADPGDTGHLDAHNEWLQFIHDVTEGKIFPGPPGPVGPAGPQGPMGAQGPEGKQGNGVRLEGSYESYSEFIKAHPTGKTGDAYLVGDYLYVWADDTLNWHNIGLYRGPEGSQGPVGPQGVEGQRGEQGDVGPEGPQGPEGPRGPIGPQGVVKGVAPIHIEDETDTVLLDVDELNALQKPLLDTTYGPLQGQVAIVRDNLDLEQVIEASVLYQQDIASVRVRIAAGSGVDKWSSPLALSTYTVVDETTDFAVTADQAARQTRFMCNFDSDATVALPSGDGIANGSRVTLVQTAKGKILVSGTNVIGLQSTKQPFDALEFMFHSGNWWGIGGGAGGSSPEGAPGKPAPVWDAGSEVLSWEPVTGDAGPTLGYGALVTPSEEINWRIEGTTLVIDRVKSGIEYTFEVWGVNSAGKGESSDPIVYTWPPVAAPTLSVTSGAGSFTATWDAIPDATRYAFAYKKQTDSGWTEALIAPSTSRTVTGLNEQVAYEVRIAAEIGPVESPWSNIEVVIPGPGTVPQITWSRVNTGQWSITNYDPTLIYTTTGPGGINGSGLVSVTDANGKIKVGCKRSEGAPEEFIWFERRAYTYTRKCTDFTQCYNPCGNCRTDVNPHSWSCGCGSPCGDSGGGAWGDCICRGPGTCSDEKNPTPSGFSDSQGEWWRQSYSPLSAKREVELPQEGFFFDGETLTGYLQLSKGADHGHDLLRFASEGNAVAVFSIDTNINNFRTHYFTSELDDPWLVFTLSDYEWGDIDPWILSYEYSMCDVTNESEKYSFAGKVNQA